MKGNTIDSYGKTANLDAKLTWQVIQCRETDMAVAFADDQTAACDVNPILPADRKSQ